MSNAKNSKFAEAGLHEIGNCWRGNQSIALMTENQKAILISMILGSVNL
ncbi:hypothetical protein SGGMMB4_03193 [Sodalis glossinidius str. 'morsitans']|uniref:Uncharacterized protein n=1 Tax=Sodalis glossinidius (strain morsitans) TaxID=343509 RepID=A0A193QK44_SODGM|nr:hypothetical protein SGGMMB4_03193 [Sodalis glossinidius str. 'morsitans']